MGDPITVIKKDHTGREILHYSGHVLERGPTWIILEAFSTFNDLHRPYHTFRRGDRFVERFYSDRWYNIFEMHDVDDDHLVGWYCNITRPALLGTDVIEADDLALDIFVSPEGQITLLDQDEFAALPLDDSTRSQAERALTDLIALIQECQPPFR
jgi:protein associated with RNAse G/E